MNGTSSSPPSGTSATQRMASIGVAAAPRAAADDERPDGGEVASGVEAEPAARAPQPGREQLGQVEAERADDAEHGEPVQEEQQRARRRGPRRVPNVTQIESAAPAR